MGEFLQKVILFGFFLCIFFVSFLYGSAKYHTFDKLEAAYNASKENSRREYKVQSVNWAPYMRELEKTIKANWNPPKGDESKRVIVLFKINRSGNISDYSIKQSSGIKEADDAAIKAIETTTPFKPLPEGFKGKSIYIEFTFDYNVLKPSK